MNQVEDKRYWFFIESFAHISVKKDWIIIYNPYNGKILEYKDNYPILKIVKRILFPDNLRVIQLRKKDLDNPGIQEFITSVRKHFMGDLIEIGYSHGKPVQMPPIVKIQKDVANLKNDPMRTVGEEQLENISNFWFYINDSCNQKCKVCGSAFLQFPFCTAIEDENRELDASLVQRFMAEARSCSSFNIHVLGGNALLYSQLDTFLKIFVSYPSKYFYLHYLNVSGNEDKLNHLARSGWHLNLLCHFPLNVTAARKVLSMVSGLGIKYTFFFAIKSEEEFEEAEKFTTRFNLSGVEYHPFYDGTNLEFFRENLFIERDEIEGTQPSLKEIYAREKVNPLFFGHIIVMPHKRVYTNINTPPLGILGRDSLYDIVYKEMIHHKNWFKVRNHISPCRSCVFNRLCPPISNYNFVFGKYNLCRIHG